MFKIRNVVCKIKMFLLFLIEVFNLFGNIYFLCNLYFFFKLKKCVFFFVMLGFYLWVVWVLFIDKYFLFYNG